MEQQDGKKHTKDQFVFAFEELENNLHPALLRRLFKYLLEYVRREKCTLFLTTHSSVALDFFGPCEDAHFIHVTRQNDTSVAKVVNAHFDKLGVLSELGAKPSDLLQANGIIWVEGPSDRIYLNKWINLFSGGQLQEGRDYQCAFYGGALLARTQAVEPEKEIVELVNLIRVNPNIIVVCDSDKNGKATKLKDRVLRLKAEVDGIPGALMWITQAKEIENYLPGPVLEKVFDLKSLADPEMYESIFPPSSKTKKRPSYFRDRLNRSSYDKMDLALEARQYMTRDNMSGRFDLDEKIIEIVKKISEWNR